MKEEIVKESKTLEERDKNLKENDRYLFYFICFFVICTAYRIFLTFYYYKGYPGSE
jgi:hypothetical protein